MRESQHDHLEQSIDHERTDRVVRGGEKKGRKSKDRKAKSRKRYSLSKKKVHPVTAMANGSEAKLSPTIERKTKLDRKKKALSSAPADNHEEAPAMRLTSSSEGDKDESGSDVQDENTLVAPESSYTSDSDPYVYSDDSESFSDAYFRPSFNDYPAVLYPRSTSHGSMTSALTVPPSEVDPLAPFSPHPYHMPSQLGYGSLPVPERSPFKKISSIASILEDSPVDEKQQLLNGDPSLLHQNYSYPNPAAAAEMDAQYLKQNKKERRRNRKQQKAATRQRQMQMIQNQQRQKEQVDRERTVTEVKGRPQDETKYRDSAFAYIFIIQLFIVLSLAINSASTVMFAKEAPAWGTLKHTTTDGKSSTSQATVTKTTTATTTTQDQGTRHLLHRIFEQTGWHHQHHRGYLRRLHNGNLMTNTANTSSPIAKNASLHDLLVDDSDPTDDAIGTSSTPSKQHPEAQPMISTKSKSTDSTSQSGEPTSFTIDYRNAIALIGVSGLYACVLSYFSFGFMLIMSRALIQVTLVFSILLALAWGMIGLKIDPYGIISVMGFGALLLTLGYTIYNWQRVPFASTNLHTALCAMRCTSDITILGMVAILVSFTWCILWSMAFIGSVDKYDPGTCTNQRICVFEVPMVEIGLYGFFIISFYWTNTVIKNILRVTVASTIGTWWYYPQEISPFCSPAVGQPLLRSLTKSLGSICLGSLISQAVQFSYAVGRCFCCMSNCRRHAVHSICDGANEDSQEIDTRRQTRKVQKENPKTELTEGESDTTELTEYESDFSSGAPPPEKKMASSLKTQKTESNGSVGSQLRCFNRWAYSYIGLYGYGFTEGGEKALQLFEAREWTEVVRDNLIQHVLMMASIVIGGSTGSFAVLAEEVDGYDFTTLHRPVTTAFLIGSVLGFVLSNVLLLGVVGSAVNTVLVCFAAGPFEFNKNHPRLSREMIDVWGQQVWEPSA